MKLIFNIGTNGSTEIKKLLGFIDVDLKFDSLQSEIISATREIIQLIGKNIYNSIQEKYENKTEEPLIYLTQMAIAINAYRNFVPNNDLAHSNNGRKMRLQEHEKHPFEWALDRDNNALERKYYRSLDDLIMHLDDSSEEWKLSEEYKKSLNSLFRTTKDFDDVFPIQSRLLLLKLQPGIRQCLNLKIKSVLPSDTYTKLVANELKADDEILYYVKSCCAFYALAWALPRYSVQMFPEGVLQYTASDRMSTQAKKPALGNEVAYAKESFERDYNINMMHLEKLLEPELKESNEKIELPILTGTKYLSL